MTEKLYYFVFAWAHPDIEAKAISWLSEGHIAEVVAQPGVLRGRLISLHQTAPDGWRGLLSSYEFASLEAFEKYMASDEKKRFDQEGMQFAGKIRVDRSYGPMVYETTRQELGAG